jgi:transcriptional regulator of nitric oxide reductase
MPGFTGTPIDLAVAINREGEFVDIEILNQKEPVFVDGLGTAPFIEFLNQYRGKSLHQNISVGSVYGENRARQAGDSVVLDGVSKASASVRIANLTILTSARAVAGVPLNGGGRAPPARPRQDVKEILPWNELLARHLLGHLALDNRTVDQAFAGTRVAHDDTAPQNDSEGRFIDLYFALVSVPQIGVSLLGEGGYGQLMGQIQPGGHAILVMANGPYRVSPEDAVRHTVPSRLLLQQFDLPVSLRDADVAFTLAPGIPLPEQMQIFEIEQPAGFDPGSPWNLALRVVRQHGAILPETWSREFTATYALPESLFERPALGPEAATQSAWMGIWQARRIDLGLTALLLLTLALALSAQHSLTRRPLWLDRFRLSFRPHTRFYRLVRARAVEHRHAAWGGEGRGPEFRSWLFAVRPGLAAHLGLRDRDSVYLGPWHVLRLAVSVRRIARIRGPVGPPAWLARIHSAPRPGKVAGAVEIRSPRRARHWDGAGCQPGGNLG